MLRTGFQEGCYGHIPPFKSGEDNQWIQLKIMLIKGACSLTPYTIVQHSFWLTFRKRRMVISLLLFISRAWDVIIFLVFPHDYICTFHIYFNKRNTSFVSKFAPFPELTDILLRKRCETSGRYWHKHELEGAMYYCNLGFRKSVPRAISSLLPSRN